MANPSAGVGRLALYDGLPHSEVSTPRSSLDDPTSMGLLLSTDTHSSPHSHNQRRIVRGTPYVSSQDSVTIHSTPVRSALHPPTMR